MAVTHGYILPYHKGVRIAIGLSVYKKLSQKAKLKIMAWELNKIDNLSLTRIANLLKVHKSTISRWIRQVNKAKKFRTYQALNPKSKRPKTLRTPKKVNYKIKDLILLIRKEYRCGKDKIAFLLKKLYGISVSASSVHRFLTKLDRSEDPLFKIQSRTHLLTGKKRKRKKVKRYKDIKHKLKYIPLELWQIDTAYFGKYYIISAIDVVSKLSFSYAYSNKSSRSAMDFLLRLALVYKLHLKDIKVFMQRDNGSEFRGEFEIACERLSIQLINTPIHSPEKNGVIERFNRTKKEWLKYEPIFDMPSLRKYLINFTIFYNYKRPHYSLNYDTPMEYYTKNVEKVNNSILSGTGRSLHMLWTYTQKRT